MRGEPDRIRRIDASVDLAQVQTAIATELERLF